MDEQQTQPLREVAQKAMKSADAAVGTVAHEGKALANALRGAADQAEREGARYVQGSLRSVADLFERWADKTEGQGARRMFSDLEAFGRREPLTFFGAAAALGFLGTRALRAGAEARSETTMSPETSGQAAAGRQDPAATALDTAPARSGASDETFSDIAPAQERI